MVKVCVPLLALASAGAQPLPKGQLIEKVVCQADPAKSYALYVPSHYDPSRRWPVVFGLEPGARGRIPVERFQEGAEKFGYIIAGSNDSRNGPWAPTLEAFKAMFIDVNSRFSLDIQRVYLAGHSGGARASLGLAMAGGGAGVFACGAAFGEIKPPTGEPFVVFGAAGHDDFNYTELRKMDADLDAVKMRHRVMFFPGGHQWAPKEIHTAALEWFEMEAMRIGARPKDEALIRAALAGRLARIPTLSDFEAQLEYQSIATDFAGFLPVEEYAGKAAELDQRKSVRDWQKSEQSQQSREQELLRKITSLGEEGGAGALRSLVAGLKEKAEAAEDSPDRRATRRALAGAAGYGAETGRDLIESGQYRRAATLFEMVTILRPENAYGHYRLARARGFLGDKKKAYASLREASLRGFRVDSAEAARDLAFSKFTKDPEFQAILASQKN